MAHTTNPDRPLLELLHFAATSEREHATDTHNHIGLYDQPEFVDPAIDRVSDWMAEYL